MRVLIQMIFLTCLLGACAGNAAAQEPVAPPFTEPAERWMLTYDNYQAMGSSNERYKNLTREVRIVRDEENLYIKGIFPSYPESWTLATVTGNELQFEQKQILQIVDGVPMYFRMGTAHYCFNSGNTYWLEFIEFCPDGSPGVPNATITISDDGTTITANENINGRSGAFWYDEIPDGRLYFEHGAHHVEIDGQTISVPYGEDFPDKDYMVNMVFRKMDGSGVKDLGVEADRDETQAMYDFLGRKVNPETARPGIYIRNGKKIIKR